MEVEMDEKFNFAGQVQEEEFTGVSGKELTVRGFIDNDHISFVKQYPCAYEYDGFGNIIIDESRRGHEVIYDGYWDDESGSWVGEWEVEGETEVLQSDKITTRIYLGSFEMKMIE
jgi:hypothetical protein